MSSNVCISGDKPPWTHRNCWFISAANGRQSNASIQESYTRSVYLILPEKKYYERLLKYLPNKVPKTTAVLHFWM